MSDKNAQAAPNISTQEIITYLQKTAQTQLNLTKEQIDQIGINFHLVEGLQLDSLAQVTLISAIEDDFGFLLELEDREKIQTVRDLVEIIQARAVKSPCH